MQLQNTYNNKIQRQTADAKQRQRQNNGNTTQQRNNSNGVHLYGCSGKEKNSRMPSGKRLFTN
jgi:hypothetical protein